MSETHKTKDRTIGVVGEHDPHSLERSVAVNKTEAGHVTKTRDASRTVSPAQEDIDPRAFAKALLVSDKEIMDYLAR
ncbi:hypothetical protein [Rhizobium sp. FKL33]|jgi:hypothetical protein|uniref:hypothetical protein n=1 Tax=Rhizobium sp. FKL33 TaxID=2562307 RepID=UPI0010BF8D14|nr:hypothetical protein [Rhizobium sp. FKL33]